jgi:hypothetical protein
VAGLSGIGIVYNFGVIVVLKGSLYRWSIRAMAILGMIRRVFVFCGSVHRNSVLVLDLSFVWGTLSTFSQLIYQ